MSIAGRIVLGFDARGVGLWEPKSGGELGLIALRDEVLDIVKTKVPGMRGADFWGMTLKLAVRDGAPGGLTLWVLKDSGHGFPQDEYAVSQAIARAKKALGSRPGA